jgi:hypothetical protein
MATTPGDEPAQNGRVEQLIGGLKRDVRVPLKAASLDESYWPLALQHAAELKFRRVLSQLGASTPKLLPFGCQVLVRTKIWRQRAQPWKWPMESATALGPASSMSLSSSGHWVEVDNGRVGFRATVVVKPSFHATQEAGIVPLQAPQQVHHLVDDDEVYSPSYAPEHLDNDMADVAMDDNTGDLDASGHVHALPIQRVPAEQCGRPALPWGTATNVASSWLLHLLPQYSCAVPAQLVD